MQDYLNESLEIAKAAYKGLDDKMGKDIIILDLHELTPIADYFVIATANNPNQMKALQDACEEEVLKTGNTVVASEGQNTGWILLDFGCVMVHIFSKENREFYNLERIWADAKQVK